MVKKFLTALKIVQNRNKIKDVINDSYSAINKTIDALEFILKQANETKLGKSLQKNLPPVISVLSKVKQIFEKYGSLVGLELITEQRLEEEESISISLIAVQRKLDEILE